MITATAQPEPLDTSLSKELGCVSQLTSGKWGTGEKTKQKNLPSSVHICTHHSEAYTYMHISDAYIRSHITDVHIYIVLVPQRFSFLFV